MGGELISRATKVLGDGVLLLLVIRHSPSQCDLTLTVSIMEAILFICVLLQKRGLLFWSEARGTLVKGDRELRYNKPVEILFPAERLRVFI